MNIGWTLKFTEHVEKAKEIIMTFIIWHLLAIVSVMAASFALGYLTATKTQKLLEK